MKIVKEFILREIAGECVLVPTGATSQEFNGMITISDTAKFIWENIERWIAGRDDPDGSGYI